MLKFGQLYLDRGLWNGRRIVSEDWVMESTRSHRPPDPSLSESIQLLYGYHWRSRHMRPHDDPKFYYFVAMGGGGQLIIVFPELDMVIVFTGGHYGTSIGERQHSELLDNFIAPALLP